MNYEIHQYTSPRSTKRDNTRWVAAKTQADADKAARRRGWRTCGGRILPHHTARTARQLRGMGVDVVA